MDVGLQQRRERIVHQAMPLHQRLAGKLLRHDQHTKVPLAAAADAPPGTARALFAVKAVVANYSTCAQTPPASSIRFSAQYHLQAAKSCFHSPTVFFLTSF